jgi:hypothetical protein
MKKLLTFITLASLTLLSAQFSSSIDYNKETKKENREYAGITLSGYSANAKWDVDYYKNNQTSEKNNYSSKISNTTFAGDLFINKTFQNHNWELTLGYKTTNKKTSFNAVMQDTTFRNSFPETDINENFLQLKISDFNENYSLKIKTDFLELKRGDVEETNSFYATISPYYRILKTDTKKFGLLGSYTFFGDDNFENKISPYISNFYDIPSEYMAGMVFGLFKTNYALDFYYRFNNYPDFVYDTAYYSNIEADYKYKFINTNIDLNARAGFNFEMDKDILTKSIPLFYYTLGVSNKFFDEKLVFTLSWDYAMTKTKIGDDEYLKVNFDKKMDTPENPLSNDESDYLKNIFRIALKYNFRE